MLEEGEELSSQNTQLLEAIQALYEQQRRMYKQKTHSVENRIVSLQQPHIRPLPRGKANVKTESGAKLAITIIVGYAFADHISYDNSMKGYYWRTR